MDRIQTSHSNADELYRAIGHVAANWSMVELVSGLVLIGLIGSQDGAVAQAIVAGQSTQSIWDTIETILETWGSDGEAELEIFRRWRRIADTFRVRRNEA